MVFSRDLKKIVKKKYSASSKDKEDWVNFIKNIGHINPKKEDLSENETINTIVPKLDLHGFSLSESNEKVKNFIYKAYELGLKKVIIITGKGSRSKSYDNPYVSETLGVLRYSIPDFIRNNVSLNDKVSSVSNANVEDGAEGALYIS